MSNDYNNKIQFHQSDLIHNLNAYFSEKTNNTVKVNETGICQAITFTYINHFLYHNDKGKSFLALLQEMSAPSPKGIKAIASLYDKPESLLKEKKELESYLSSNTNKITTVTSSAKERLIAIETELSKAYEELAIIDEVIFHYLRSKDSDSFLKDTSQTENDKALNSLEFNRTKSDKEKIAGLNCYNSCSIIFNTDLINEPDSTLKRFFKLGDIHCPFENEGIYELIIPRHSMLVKVEDGVLTFFDPNYGFFDDPEEISKLLVEYKNPNQNKMLLGVKCFKANNQISPSTIGSKIEDRIDICYNTWLSSISEEEQLFVAKELLLFSVLTNQPQMVAKLLASVDISKLLNKEEYNESLFILACKTGNLNVVKEFLSFKDSKELDINENNNLNLTTPLMAACENGHLNIVQELLTLNVDINPKNHANQTAFMIACQKGHLNIVQEFLNRKKIDLSEKDSSDNNVLMLACKNGHFDIAQEFLSLNQIDLSKKNSDGNNALMLACQNGHFSIVEKFLSLNQIDLSEKNSDGNNALMLACENDLNHALHQIFLKMDPNTDLIITSQSDRPRIVEELLKLDIDINLKNEKNQTAFMIACQNGYLNVVQKFLKVKQPDLSEKDSDGNNALMLACQNGHVAILQELLNARDEINLQEKNKLNKTALELALENNHDLIIKLIKNKLKKNEPIINTVKLFFSSLYTTLPPINRQKFNGKKP
jgi:ankyrin repeat protein